MPNLKTEPEQNAEELGLGLDEKQATIGDVLEAVKTLTETVGDVVESLNAMRDEYKLKTRAGIFDQTGVK